jgi:hypothetical protein
MESPALAPSKNRIFTLNSLYSLDDNFALVPFHSLCRRITEVTLQIIAAPDYVGPTCTGHGAVFLMLVTRPGRK